MKMMTTEEKKKAKQDEKKSKEEDEAKKNFTTDFDGQMIIVNKTNAEVLPKWLLDMRLKTKIVEKGERNYDPGRPKL